MAQTSIEWTDRSWNPTKGCSKVSSGCKNCYAMIMAHRLAAMGSPGYIGTTRKSAKKVVWTGRINVDYGALDLPNSWKKPSRIFVNSMSDWFHEDIGLDVLSAVWATMQRTPHHNYQILTKRPERMLAVLSDTSVFPVMDHVWLGVSVEDDETTSRLDVLRNVPAKVRFVSLEPLIGPTPGIDLNNIDWAIVGGESGPKARAIEATWVDEIFDSCRSNGTAFFFKQWGGVNKKKTGRLFRGCEWNEFPLSS